MVGSKKASRPRNKAGYRHREWMKLSTTVMMQLMQMMKQ